MPIAHLQNRTVIDLSGPDAEHFLQNIITTDLETVRNGEALPGALLSPQGKILFDFLVSRGTESLRLECRGDIADDFTRRLMLYRLRAKVKIIQQKQDVVAVEWEGDSSSSSDDSMPAPRFGDGVRDRRFVNVTVFRFYGASLPVADTGQEKWNAFRIAEGVAESGADYALGDAFPHDVLLDQTGGVGFKKGCYIGQEVVSRMQHRGTARRRVLIAHAKGGAPQTGDAITANGRAIGTMGSVSGASGLATVRIDHVKDAVDKNVPILAGNVPIGLSIPAWAGFDFPKDNAVSDSV
jgi:tRNA-modifying protein YgfZ